MTQFIANLADCVNLTDSSTPSLSSSRITNPPTVTPKLMSKAMKYEDFIAKHGKTAPRKLEDGNQEFQISSYHTINPQECVNFKVQTDNIYDENVISYAADGTAIAEKSYVIFQVTSSATAYYSDGNGQDNWIAPLGDFMEAMVTYKSAQRESYCEQCQKSVDYCYPQQDGKFFPLEVRLVCHLLIFS
jgi:hypothetical protein